MSLRLCSFGTLLLAASGVAYAFLGFGGSTSWDEEVLLHDGTKIVVVRKVERGGRHEVGQQSPIKDQTLTFTLPITKKRVSWSSGLSKDIGLADFMPLLVDVYHETPYVVSVPVGCPAYNKWGRPNPPYVAFKYEGQEWRRITLQELPAAIRQPNLIFSSPDNEVERIGKSFVTAEMIQQANGRLTQPEYKTILREPLPKERINDMCMEMVLYKGYWIMPNDPVGRALVDGHTNSK